MIVYHNPKFKDRLVSLMEARGINQTTLARKLKVSKQTITDWKTKGKEPNHDNLRYISKVCGVSIDWLLGVSDCMNPKNEAVVKYMRLSEKAIENIRHEGSSKGKDHRRIVMLDYILSDRETFTSLMDCLISLYFPSALLIPENQYSRVKMYGSDGKEYIKLSPNDIKKLTEEVPENLYPKMRQILDDFGKKIPDKPIAVNEFEDAEEITDSMDKKDKQPVRNEENH